VIFASYITASFTELFFIWFYLIYYSLFIYLLVYLKYHEVRFGKHLWNRNSYLASIGVILVISFIFLFILAGLEMLSGLSYYGISFLSLCSSIGLLLAYVKGKTKEKEIILGEILRIGEGNTIPLNHLSERIGLKEKHIKRILKKLETKKGFRGEVEYIDGEENYRVFYIDKSIYGDLGKSGDRGTIYGPGFEATSKKINVTRWKLYLNSEMESDRTYEAIKDELSRVNEQDQDIDIREIEIALEDGKIKKANYLLKEKKEKLRGWSKKKFYKYLGSTFLTVIFFSFVLTIIGPYSHYFYHSFLGFLMILTPLALSIFGMLHTKAKYRKYLWNARTYLPPAVTLLSTIVLIFYVFRGLSYPFYPLHSLLMIVTWPGIRILSSAESFFDFLTGVFFSVPFNFIGISLLLTYSIAVWKERKLLLDGIHGSGKKKINLNNLEYLLGRDKDVLLKYIQNYLSTGKLSGHIDEDSNYVILNEFDNTMIEEPSTYEESDFTDISRTQDGESNRRRTYAEIKQALSNIECEYIDTEEIESALNDGNVELADKLLENIFERLDIIKNLEEDLALLKEQEEMLDTKSIKSALDEGNIKEAEKLLEELKNKYKGYKETIDELKSLDKDLSSLSRKLARGEISDESYKSAKQNIEAEKHDLEEELNRLRQEVIYEDYQKPF